MKSTRDRTRGVPPDPGRVSRVDLTSLVDVTFQLLVFLLVANDLSAKQIEPVELPPSRFAEQAKAHPSTVVVKKGEHGALVFGSGGQFHSAAAYPIEKLVDPTGAGDTFLGGLAGAIARQLLDGSAGGGNGDGGSRAAIGFADICRAVAHGTVLASFNCESFSTERLAAVTPELVEERTAELRSFTVL